MRARHRAIAGHDLCPQVPIAIIEQMRSACLSVAQAKRIFIYGHSAGGHLAACMLAKTGKPGPGARRSGARDTISGVFDLALGACVQEHHGSTRQARNIARIECLGRRFRSSGFCGRAEHRRRLARRRKQRYENRRRHFTVVPLSDPIAP